MVQPRPTVLLLSVGLLGCEAILGIGDPALDAGAGGSDDSGGSSSGGGGALGGSGGAGGGGSGGGVTGPDFTFSISAAEVHVPYDGLSFVAVEIVRLNGFEGSVDVIVSGGPAALSSVPATIAAGQTTGELLVGATLGLAEGTTFDLEMLATSGSLAHEDTVPAVVTGKPGTLDEGFGVAGVRAWVLQDDGGSTAGVREVAGGKILLGGSAINSLGSEQPRGARLLSDGSFDNGFSGDGRLETFYCGCFAPGLFRGVARSLDSKVHFIGGAATANNDPRDVAYQRLNDDGGGDSVVGVDGKRLLDIGGQDDAFAIELDQGDFPMITGRSSGQVFVARIDAFGNLDSSYGTAGKTILDLGFSSQGNALAIDEQNRAVVAGVVQHSYSDALVVRFDDAGALDPTFGVGGVLEFDLPGDQELFFVDIDASGRILIAGHTIEQEGSDFFVARLTEDGSFDPTYGGAGMRVFVEPGDQTAVDAAMFADGRVIVAGNDATGPLLGRLRPDGDIDPTFGAGGLVSVFLGQEDQAESVTVTSDNRTILTGVRDSYPYNAVVARIWN